MKVARTRIIAECDYCSPEKRQEAIASCGICGSDVCEAHRNLIPIKKSTPKHVLGLAAPSPIPNFLRYSMEPVCPDCSFQSFMSLLDSLSKKRDYLQREATN